MGRFKAPCCPKEGEIRAGRTWKNSTVGMASDLGLEARTGLHADTGEATPDGRTPAPSPLACSNASYTTGPVPPAPVLEDPYKRRGSDLGGANAVQFAKFGFRERTAEVRLTQVGTLSFP